MHKAVIDHVLQPRGDLAHDPQTDALLTQHAGAGRVATQETLQISLQTQQCNNSWCIKNYIGSCFTFTTPEEIVEIEHVLKNYSW